MTRTQKTFGAGHTNFNHMRAQDIEDAREAMNTAEQVLIAGTANDHCPGTDPDWAAREARFDAARARYLALPNP